MKCVKSTYSDVREKHGAYRTTDKTAAMLVKTKHFEYCPKSDWKETGRRYFRSGNPFAATYQQEARNDK